MTPRLRVAGPNPHATPLSLGKHCQGIEQFVARLMGGGSGPLELNGVSRLHDCFFFPTHCLLTLEPGWSRSCLSHHRQRSIEHREANDLRAGDVRPVLLPLGSEKEGARTVDHPALLPFPR